MAMAPFVSAVSFSAHPSTADWLRTASAGIGRVHAEAVEGGKWWAPLLGWLGWPDYIEAAAPMTETEEAVRRSSLLMWALTEVKAQELCARMVETERFHDAMYHSAIASHLTRFA